MVIGIHDIYPINTTSVFFCSQMSDVGFLRLIINMCINNAVIYKLLLFFIFQITTGDDESYLFLEHQLELFGYLCNVCIINKRLINCHNQLYF